MEHGTRWRVSRASPSPGPEWIAPLSGCGFRVQQRYHSFLCNDLSQRRQRGRPARLETLRIRRASELDASAGLAQVQALLPQVHGLLHRAFQRQPWFLPLPLDTFCRLQLQSGGLASIDPHSSLLAFAGEQLVGLLLAHPADASGTTLVIRTLAVLPGRPWAGLGRLLLEQAHAAAQQRGFRQVVHALMLENGAGQALSRHYARPLRSYVLLGRRLGPGPGVIGMAHQPASGWRFWIDRGGTFTDVVGRDPQGQLHVSKVLSVQPHRRGDPAVRALRQMAGLAEQAPIPAGLIEEVRLGTTVATNALLERCGQPAVLLINQGLSDLPWIGDQHRPDLFALRIVRPEPLLERVIAVEGRLTASGAELRPLRLDGRLEAELRAALAEGIRGCAVALLHSVRNPDHERRLGAWLEQLGFDPVVLSHRLSPQPRLLPRCQTSLAEASIAPVLGAYLAQVEAALGTATRLRVMQSSGGLAAPRQLHAKDTILSGPAGGMVGAVRVAEAAGLGSSPIVGFDMGGTSTDVFHFDPGRGALAWERSAETEIGGLLLQAPRLPIHTVASGGGSVLHYDGERLQVGPRSAGADPGPACYRRGGPLTVTDANLLLGRLQATHFPAVFGVDGDQPPDRGVVEDGVCGSGGRHGRRLHGYGLHGRSGGRGRAGGGDRADG